MTNEQINAEIAKVCGWIDVWRAPNASETAHFVGTSPSGEFLPVPNYCADLNAMHEAEKVLDCWDDYVSYQSWLGYCGGNVIVQLQQCITATARQRAEAFLRTLEKWEEVQDD